MVNIVTPFSEELAPSTLLRLAAVAIGVSRGVARAAIILATGAAQRRQGVAHHVWGYTTVWGSLASWRLAA
eukprot:scaffold140958_cov66-Phaeocystis_antarctica.AAC.1